MGELTHAELLSNRISELEDKAPSDPVQNYNNIAKRALEINDFVTYNLATTILADEVKEEQHTEDILKGLEVKRGQEQLPHINFNY